MSPDDFERIAAEEYVRVPERFKKLIENVALLMEDEPDEATRKEENLPPGETLLGLYRGIPATERGSTYGIGGSLPDTITLYRLPILEEATDIAHREGFTGTYPEAVREAIRETLWHEIGHYFGLDEHSVGEREHRGSNHYDT